MPYNEKMCTFCARVLFQTSFRASILDTALFPGGIFSNQTFFRALTQDICENAHEIHILVLFTI